MKKQLLWGYDKSRLQTPWENGVKVKTAVSPPWPCQCISASPWAPAQPTSRPGSWWPLGCPDEGVPAAPASDAVCRTGGKRSSAAALVARSSPPPLPLLCFHTPPATPGPGHTTRAADDTSIKPCFWQICCSFHCFPLFANIDAASLSWSHNYMTLLRAFNLKLSAVLGWI